MLINSAWAVQRFWKGCVGRWWRRGKWGGKVNKREDAACLTALKTSAHNFVCLKETAFPSRSERMVGATFSMLRWLLRPDFFKSSPEGSDFQWMRSILLLKWGNAVHAAVAFGLLCSLNQRILFPILCFCSTWTDLKAATSGYSLMLLLQSGLYLTHLQYLQRHLCTSGFHVHLLVSCVMPGETQGREQTTFSRIKLLGTHLGIQDAEEIRPKTDIQNPTCARSHVLLPTWIYLFALCHNSWTLGTANSR